MGEFITVVVLGMHGSGTSLVSNMLRQMGIRMSLGKWMGPMKGMPTWEDFEMVRCNISILKHAGGSWRYPPKPAQIIAVAKGRTPLRRRMHRLISARDGPGLSWGFKDPRTSLTVPAWHPLLARPLYIRVTRNVDSIAKSLMGRGKPAGKKKSWRKLTREYNKRIGAFLSSVADPRFMIRYEDLVNRQSALRTVTELAQFLRLPHPARAARKAVEVIEYR